jgi:hypothetical protein
VRDLFTVVSSAAEVREREREPVGAEQRPSANRAVAVAVADANADELSALL